MTTPIDTRSSAGEFVRFARMLMLNRGSPSQALAEAEAGGRPVSGRILEVLRSASAVGTTSSPTWAAPLVSYQLLTAGFQESLRSISVYDAALSSMRKVPIGTRIAVTTIASVGAAAGEAQPKAVSEMAFNAADLPLQKVSCLTVLSRELLDAPGVEAVLSAELRRGAAAATDSGFIASITVGAPSIPATADPAADLAAAVSGMTLGTSSKLYLALPPKVVAGLSFASGTAGFLYPDLAPDGGSIAGVMTMPCDAVTAADQGVIFDADQIVTAPGDILLDASDHASLQMDSAPSAAAAAPYSLWQANARAIRCERWYSVWARAATGVAVIGDVSAWTA